MEKKDERKKKRKKIRRGGQATPPPHWTQPKGICKKQMHCRSLGEGRGTPTRRRGVSTYQTGFVSSRCLVRCREIGYVAGQDDHASILAIYVAMMMMVMMKKSFWPRPALVAWRPMFVCVAGRCCAVC